MTDSEDLDLAQLGRMHPVLPTTLVQDLAVRAAVALQRRNHEPGCRLWAELPDSAASGFIALDWETVPAATTDQLDSRRVTEDGAEAVALALVSISHEWVVRRRLQQGEYADWLLRDAAGTLVALEISGVDGRRDAGRVQAKLREVAKSTAASGRSACVVAFELPAADLAMVEQ